MMERLIREMRTRAGWDSPWFVAQVSYHNSGDLAAPEIRAAQAALWKQGLALEGPDTDTLTGEYRQNHGAGVHMSALGLRAHARLWTEKVGDWLDGPPLSLAAQYGDVSEVRALLGRGANPNVRDKDGQTPLMRAASVVDRDRFTDRRPVKSDYPARRGGSA
jgi:hypothetical protein